jgi:glycosyltransferase involved in cell wall biosynthesis
MMANLPGRGKPVMIADIRVGIPAIGGKGWLGGVSFIELHTKAVAALPVGERPKQFLIVGATDAGNLELYLPFITLFDGIIRMGVSDAAMPPTTEIPQIYCADENELFQKIDFYFPASFRVLPRKCAASWIHDFQHRHLPEFFSPQDIARRDMLCQLIADHARLVFCTSRAVENDFRRFFPASQAVTRALPLRVTPEETWFDGDPLSIQARYNLPAEFILCCNQFWVHKNHWRLLAALALLRRAGRDVHLVCTGATADYRFPAYFQKLQEYIAALGIGDLVRILGLIPREHQIQLLRRCLFVVQPSLFEGLSLIVQECRALGKPIVLSDLDVHREHGYGTYFDRHSADDLAAKIAAALSVASPGPDVRRETEARLQAHALCRAYGKQFCTFAAEAVAMFAGPGKMPPPWNPVLPGAVVPPPEQR